VQFQIDGEGIGTITEAVFASHPAALAVYC
jgi:hypothetical protein